MKRYEASSFGNVFVWRDGKRTVLPPRLELRNHSPTGFGWGYSGSGPAQLALALLCDVLDDDERACRLYQQFKARAIATINRDGKFEMTSDEVMRHVEALEAEA